MGSRLICQSCLPELAEELLLPFRVRVGAGGIEGDAVGTVLPIQAVWRFTASEVAAASEAKAHLYRRDPETAWHLQRRIGELTELLRQTNELEALTAHYYERGYTRNEKYTL